ncbi:hypothetical protein [Roseateles sp.]|uniref:hypothetical protein n=1 Tax=Roseateles sp. TaxID=1971397 RepID=UPI00286BC604|nr:hypothetical protein [Roseateles sp.]
MSAHHGWALGGAGRPLVPVVYGGWAAALLLCIALLVLLQGVLQRAVDQAGLQRAIAATQTVQARRCTALAGGRVQESCLLALNERARLSAQATLVGTAAQLQTSSP